MIHYVLVIKKIAPLTQMVNGAVRRASSSTNKSANKFIREYENELCIATYQWSR